MNARSLAVLLLVATTLLSGCRSSRTTSPPPGPQTAPPAVPPPAPAPPPPQVTPQPEPPSASVPDQPALAPPAAYRPHQDILRLKQSGFSDEFLLNKIRGDNINYQLTTTEILEMRAAGISETVLQAMLRSGQPAAETAGASVSRKAEFAGLAHVEKGFLGIFGTSTKDVGRLVIEGDQLFWYEAKEPDDNFSIYVRNIKEIFNTCVLRPGQNLCLEFGVVTYTGEEHRFRDPGWKDGENRLVIEATDYFRREFPSLFFTQRTEKKL
jgi:hypothetical protein